MAELQTTGGAVRPKTTQNPFSKISPPVKYTRSTQFHNSPTKGHKKHQSEKPVTSSLPETTVQSSKKTAKNKNGASSKKSHRAKEVGGGSDGGPVISNSTSPSSNSLDHLIARHQQQQQRFSQVTPPAPPAALSAIINEQDDGQQAEAAVAAASRPTRQSFVGVNFFDCGQVQSSCAAQVDTYILKFDCFCCRRSRISTKLRNICFCRRPGATRPYWTSPLPSSTTTRRWCIDKFRPKKKKSQSSKTFGAQCLITDCIC